MHNYHIILPNRHLFIFIFYMLLYIILMLYIIFFFYLPVVIPIIITFIIITRMIKFWNTEAFDYKEKTNNKVYVLHENIYIYKVKNYINLILNILNILIKYLLLINQFAHAPKGIYLIFFILVNLRSIFEFFEFCWILLNGWNLIKWFGWSIRIFFKNFGSSLNN